MERKGKGREGLKAGVHNTARLSEMPHTPKGNENSKPSNLKETNQVNLLTVSRSSKRHCLSAYCMHSLPRVLEGCICIRASHREENGGPERRCCLARVTQ